VAGKDRTRPDLAAEIGRRLLQAGRAKEAVAALEVAAPKKRTARSDLDDDDDLYGPGWDGPDAEWESVYIDKVWIPMMPPGHTEVKASTCSNLMPSTVLR
jgi:hypothetical protein